jgi:hypothetical protein
VEVEEAVAVLGRLFDHAAQPLLLLLLFDRLATTKRDDVTGLQTIWDEAQVAATKMSSANLTWDFRRHEVRRRMTTAKRRRELV